MSRFLPQMLFEWPLLFTKCVNLDVHLCYAAIQNLVYGCGNVPQTTAESSDTSLIQCAQHVQQSVDMYIHLPTGLQCDPAQIVELRQHVQDAWDNLLQDDTWHLYDHFHERIHACMPPVGTTLCIDVTVWAPLIVICVFLLV